MGTPTTTGALSNSPAGTAIPMLPPNPTATYSPDGTLHDQQPIPYTPAGGLGTNGTEPVYRVQSDFDYQSILLGLYQEWIELDLFHNILATFSEEEFTAAGLTPSDRFLIEFMADQESGHATLLSNLLGGPGGATPQCTYNYPFTTVHEAFDFTQKLTRFGESGVWGFQVFLEWDNPGQAVGPNNSYITATSAGAPEWVLWVSQLNITYSPLTNITARDGKNYGQTIQPDVSTYEGDPAINGTMFIALTDANMPYTAFNLSMVNPHVAAGPFLYQAG